MSKAGMVKRDGMLQGMDLSPHSCKLHKIYQDNMQFQTRHTWTKNVLLKVFLKRLWHLQIIKPGSLSLTFWEPETSVGYL